MGIDGNGRQMSRNSQKVSQHSELEFNAFAPSWRLELFTEFSITKQQVNVREQLKKMFFIINWKLLFIFIFNN